MALQYGCDMAHYKYPAVFPGEEGEALRAAAEQTGLSINQIIVRAVRDRLPVIVAEHQPPTDLSPLPEAALKRYYARMSSEEIALDNAASRASVRAQAKARS